MGTVWSPAGALSPTDTISELQFGPEDLLAVASWDGSVRVSNFAGDWSAQWQTSRPQFSVAWSLADARLYFGGAECRVSVADCVAQQQFDLVATPSVVTSLATSRGVLAVGTAQGAKLFDHRVRCASIAGVGPSMGVIDLDVEPSGTNLVVAGADGYCQLWDTRSLGQPRLSCKPLGSEVPLLKVKLSPDANVFAVSNKQSHVAVEYLEQPERSFVFKTNRACVEPGASRAYPVYGLDFHSNTLATAGADKCIYIWDFEQRRLKRRVSFAMPCMSISFSRSGRHCAVALSNDEWARTPAKFTERSHAKVMLGELK